MDESSNGGFTFDKLIRQTNPGGNKDEEYDEVA